MSKRRVDLNLLHVFCSVMTERSVTRAAERLAMSQPAVSNALKRLRKVFDDTLFIKTRTGVEPTERALEVWPEIARSIENLQSLTEPPDFDPLSSRATYHLAVTDTLAGRLVPALARRFEVAAPFARVHFHMHADPGSCLGIEKGTLDCAVGMFPAPRSDLRFAPLLADEYVCIYPRGKEGLSVPITMHEFLSSRHVLVKQTSSWTGIVDTWLGLIGQTRNNVMVVNHAGDAISVVLETGLIAAVPRRYVETSPQSGQLTISRLPFPAEKIIYKLAWHVRNSRDPGSLWLRRTIHETLAQAMFKRSSLMTPSDASSVVVSVAG